MNSRLVAKGGENLKTRSQIAKLLPLIQGKPGIEALFIETTPNQPMNIIPSMLLYFKNILD